MRDLSPNLRTRLLLLVVLAVTAAACTGGAQPAPTTVPVETTTTAALTTTTEAPVVPEGMDELPDALQETIIELSGVVEELRGLEFVEPPSVRVVTADELEVLVREDIEENVENLDTDEALDVLLGLIEPDTSLLDTYLDLYGEQVAGFYDTDTKELVVPLRSDAFSALERSTIVHELTHALTDQHFDLGTTYDQLYDEQRYDEVVAFQALIEGDAVATEFEYLMGLSLAEKTELLEESLEADSTALDAAPRFIQESLLFPYTAGREFVVTLLEEGGFEAVDEAYSQPPVSSEQIITPEDYRTDLPMPIEVPVLDIEGYELIYDATWGELSFELMFNQILGGRPEAADGWGGDRYMTLFDGEDVVMLLAYAGDTPDDAVEMAQALIDYAETGMEVGEGEERDDAMWFTGEDFALVDRQDQTVYFLAASDPAIGEAMAATLVRPTA